VLGLWPHRMFGGTPIMLRAPCDFLHIADETVYIFAIGAVELFNAIDSSQIPAAHHLVIQPGPIVSWKETRHSIPGKSRAWLLPAFSWR